MKPMYVPVLLQDGFSRRVSELEGGFEINVRQVRGPAPEGYRWSGDLLEAMSGAFSFSAESRSSEPAVVRSGGTPKDAGRIPVAVIQAFQREGLI